MTAMFVDGYRIRIQFIYIPKGTFVEKKEFICFLIWENSFVDIGSGFGTSPHFQSHSVSRDTIGYKENMHVSFKLQFSLYQ